MTKQRGTWKRTVATAAAVAAPALALFGGAALAESGAAAVPAQSIRVESQRADAPSTPLPWTIRHEATTYRVSADECAGSVCAGGVTVTTPALEVSKVGGPVETPTVELGTGAVSAELNVTEDSVEASAFYGAIGVSYEVSPYEVLPRH